MIAKVYSIFVIYKLIQINIDLNYIFFEGGKLEYCSSLTLLQ
jgi:hypothetical protein